MNNVSTTLGTRLKTARKSKNWRQEDLSDRSGVKQSTISKIERDIQKTSTEVVKLAHALKVSAIWLSDGIGPMYTEIDKNTPEVEEDCMLYQYFDPRCIKGSYFNSKDKPSCDTLSVSSRTLAGLGVAADDAIAYVQDDESGGMTLAHGDEGVIDSSQTEPELNNGRLFAIASGHRVIVRRITVNSIGGLLVSSDSSDKSRFPDELFTALDRQQLNIIGRLCWSSGRK